MKKVLIIAGGLALIGGVVYFYSKNKKVEEKGTSSTNTTTPTTIPTTTPTTVVNSELSPLSVAYGDDEIKLQKAKSIVKQYTLLSKDGLINEKNALKTINAKLKKIGYTYKDGLLKKI